MVGSGASVGNGATVGVSVGIASSVGVATVVAVSVATGVSVGARVGSAVAVGAEPGGHDPTHTRSMVTLSYATSKVAELEPSPRRTKANVRALSGRGMTPANSLSRQTSILGLFPASST